MSGFAPHLYSLPSDCPASGVFRAVVVLHPLLTAQNGQIYFFFSPSELPGLHKGASIRDVMGATPLWIHSLNLPGPDVLVAVV